ncbi:hypothetical protein BROUX41_001489 [Berkeleyomyces rouxiae]|uniref:uncharacterized protein n=1 Tax=Berkeleyomyces rouxiae TaxID=2035830 RepID=UPI003B808F47
MEAPPNALPAPAHLVPSLTAEEDADLLTESTYELVSNIDTESQDGRLTPMLSLGTASQGGEDDVHSLADSNSDVEVDVDAHDSDHYDHEIVPSQLEIDQANDVRRRIACRSATDLVDDDEDYDTTPMPSQTLINYVSVTANIASRAAASSAARNDAASVVTESDESEDGDDVMDGDGPDLDRTPRSSHLVVIDKDLSHRHILDLFHQCAASETLSRSPSIDYMEDSLDKPSTPTLSMTLERPKHNGSPSPFAGRTKRSDRHGFPQTVRKYGLPRMSILETLAAILLIFSFFGGISLGFYKLATLEKSEVLVRNMEHVALPINMPTATTTIVNYHTSVRYIYVTKTETPAPTPDPFAHFPLRRFWCSNDKPAMIYEKSSEAWSKLSRAGDSLKKKLHSKKPNRTFHPPPLDHYWTFAKQTVKAWKKGAFTSPVYVKVMDSFEHLTNSFGPQIFKELHLASLEAREISARCKMGYLRAQIRAKSWWLHMRGHKDESKLYAARGDKYLKDRLHKLSQWTRGRT